MSEVKHTPGPWEFDESEHGVNSHPGFGLLYSNGRPLGVTVHAYGYVTSECSGAIANARLIAAAPEMLAVCVKLSEYGKAMCKQNMTEAEAEKAELDLADAILDSDEAIAKATGNAAESV